LLHEGPAGDPFTLRSHIEHLDSLYALFFFYFAVNKTTTEKHQGKRYGQAWFAMTHRKPLPGVSRETRLSDEGLQRLERQLRAGTISKTVLEQWVRRYGKAAQQLIDRYLPGKDGV
jgi:hypothetical protein